MEEKNDIEKERRSIVQEPIIENGRLAYVKIPNYVRHLNFLTENEQRFYDFLKKEVKRVNQNNNNEDIVIFCQVALNRIIDQNNRREPMLEKDIFAHSIDFVIYSESRNLVVLCIELNDFSHNKDERQLRDDIIKEALESSHIDIVFQKNQSENYLNIQNEYTKKIEEILQENDKNKN